MPTGGRGRAPTSVPKPLTSLVHLRPRAHWDTRSGGARGSAPRLAQGSWPTTNEKGNGPARMGWGAVTGSYLRAPARPGTAREGRFPFPTRLALMGLGLRPYTLICAPHGVSAARPPVIYTQQWPADSPRPGRGGGVPPSPPGFTAGGGEGGVRREFNNWLRP